MREVVICFSALEQQYFLAARGSETPLGPERFECQAAALRHAWGLDRVPGPSVATFEPSPVAA